jgi:hypothetical protein
MSLSARRASLSLCPSQRAERLSLYVPLSAPSVSRVSLLCALILLLRVSLYVPSYYYEQGGARWASLSVSLSVSWYYYYSVSLYLSSYYSYMCVLILLLYMCPHTTPIYVSSYYYRIRVLILLLLCVLILVYVCPQTRWASCQAERESVRTHILQRRSTHIQQSALSLCMASSSTHTYSRASYNYNMPCYAERPVVPGHTYVCIYFFKFFFW